MTSASAARVTFVVDSGVYGGAEAYVERLVGHLPPRFECDLLAARPVPPPLAEAIRRRGGQILVTDPVVNKADFSAIARFAGALRAARPDLVHVNLATVANNRHALALAGLWRPTVATLHIVAPITSGIQRRALAIAFRRVGRVLAVSEEIASQLRRDVGVAPETIAVVPNGVEEAPAAAFRQEALPLRIGGLGRLTAQKGFDVLIEAVRRLVQEGVRVEVEIAGEGPELPALRRAAAGLPIAFSGWTGAPRAFLESLDVFCLPSRWEGLPFALLEAMMCGLPCVCTPVGDIGIAARGCCLLVPPDDPGALAAALRELINSPERRRSLGRAARARALSRHSVRGMAAATAAIYDELLGRR